MRNLPPRPSPVTEDPAQRCATDQLTDTIRLAVDPTIKDIIVNDTERNETGTALPTIDHWVDDARWAGNGERFGDVFDPARGEVAARVRLASSDDVDTVVLSARRAHVGWRETSLSRRSAVLFAFGRRSCAGRTSWRR